MTAPLALHTFRGTHRDIGVQHGTACRGLVTEHLRTALRRLDRAGVPRPDALRAALEYRPYVQEYAPGLDAEITGLAEGAGVSLAEAYLLQLRAEVSAELLGAPDTANECTTFAALPEATATGTGLAGQNADLPALYRRFMVVLRILPDRGPGVLMATPAGQVSYIGINDTGMAAFGNFLHCDGWGRGFPRYLLTRFALGFPDVATAHTALRALPRASSRNLMLLDSSGGPGGGEAVDFENTPRRNAALHPSDGLLAHANHYLAPELLDEERAGAADLANSRVRQTRMEQLLRKQHGRLAPEVMSEIMRDRSDGADSLSVEPGDGHGRMDGAAEGADGDERHSTVASVIAEPARRRIWVAPGPPSQSGYTEYSFAEGRGDAVAF